MLSAFGTSAMFLITYVIYTSKVIVLLTYSYIHKLSVIRVSPIITNLKMPQPMEDTTITRPDDSPEVKKRIRMQKNRESAQNSRQRKKEYIASLEAKVTSLELQCDGMKSRIEDLVAKNENENENANENKNANRTQTKRKRKRKRKRQRKHKRKRRRKRKLNANVNVNANLNENVNVNLNGNENAKVKANAKGDARDRMK